MNLVLLRSTMVRGTKMRAGDQIECPEKEGRLWCALGWARQKEDEEEKKAKRGRYNRRDMRADD